MAQDIRKMLKEITPETPKLSKGHEARFETRLEDSFSDLPTSLAGSRPSISWLRVAAIAITFIGVSVFGYLYFSDTKSNPIVNVTTEKEDNSKLFSLGDLSPDLKKVEDYYLTGINVQLASLKITKENRDLIDGYMQRLSELDKEYSKLNLELNEVGPNEATITALIDNLKLRLELLFKLKNKLKELKNQENEQFNSIQT